MLRQNFSVPQGSIGFCHRVPLRQRFLSPAGGQMVQNFRRTGCRQGNFFRQPCQQQRVPQPEAFRLFRQALIPAVSLFPVTAAVQGCRRRSRLLSSQQVLHIVAVRLVPVVPLLRVVFPQMLLYPVPQAVPRGKQCIANLAAFPDDQHQHCRQQNQFDHQPNPAGSTVLL